ncbi:MAG: DUF488 family protein [Microbacterium sp.]
MELHRKRAYDTAEPSDGFRVLVDRLWPRGVSKEHAAIDLWAKEVAPSAELRTALHADPEGFWHEFTDRYRAELAGPAAGALADLVDRLQGHPVVTLVYAVHDTAHNNVVVLEDVLRERLG